MSKIDAYIGFAKKSKSIVFGQDSVKRSRAVRLVIVSSLASEKTKKEMKFYVQKNNINLIEFEGSLAFTKDCKVAGITNQELANAIMNNLESGYRLVLTGGGLNGNYGE